MQKAILLLLTLPLLLPACLSADGKCQRLSKLPKDKGLGSLEKAAKKHECTHLTHALQATHSFYTHNENPGIKKRKFLKTALYIESRKEQIKAGKKHFLKKKKTGLRTALEYDPAIDHTYIVLDNKKAYVGGGAKKQVYKAILYSTHHPKLVARGEQNIPMEEEIEAHKALRGAPGIMRSHSITKHKDKKNRYTTLYSDLYQGTLGDIILNRKIGLWNKLLIMHDILEGIESMHSRGYVHRDLHAYNYLLGVEKDSNQKKVYRAVIADLGRTIKIKDANKVAAQATRRLTAPEGFKPEKLKGKDYFSTDIYALGCIFHKLYHNKQPAWADDYLKSHSISNKKKGKMLYKRLKKGTNKRRKELEQKRATGGRLTVQQDTELLILNMVRKNPDKRGDASKWRQEVERIMKRF